MILQIVGVIFTFLTLLGGLIYTWTRLTSSIAILSTRLDSLEKTMSSMDRHMQSVEGELSIAVIELSKAAIKVSGQIDMIVSNMESLKDLLEKHQIKFDQYDKDIKDFYKDYQLQKKDDKNIK